MEIELLAVRVEIQRFRALSSGWSIAVPLGVTQNTMCRSNGLVERKHLK
jgi:hypothetical protein